MKFDVTIPHGGLNGSLDMCVTHILNQTMQPAAIRVLIDSEVTLQPSPWLIRMCRQEGVLFQMIYDDRTTSIIDMRIKLLYMTRSPIAITVDDDMILHHSAFEYLIDEYLRHNNDDHNVPFVEGHRIEIGGRKDSMFSTHERKQVSEAQLDIAEPQSFGDTALLLMNVDQFKSLDRTKLLKHYDGRNIGGSDFAWTSIIAQKYGPGRACPRAYGWHTASEQKGYWKNYAMADRVFDLHFKQGANDDDQLASSAPNDSGSSGPPVVN